MNLGGAASSCLQKTNHITAEGNGDYRIYIYSVVTRAQINKMDCGLAFSEITFYCLLQEMCRVIIARDLFLKTNRMWKKKNSDTEPVCIVDDEFIKVRSYTLRYSNTLRLNHRKDNLNNVLIL